MGASGITSRGVIGRFYAKLEEYMGKSWIDLVSMLFQSDQASEDYKWLGMPPAMREWLGGRHAHGLREDGITIKNKLFESTMEIPVPWMRRDKTGQINVRIAEMAQRAVAHWSKLLSTFITNGTGSTNGLCYDGQYFFDIDHVTGDNVTSQLNLLAAAQVTALTCTTAGVPTHSEAISAILGVIAYMLTYKDDKNEPINAEAKNFLIMTAPVLWARLAPAVISDTTADGETNVIKELKKDGFNVSIVCNPRLTYTTQFVTFRTDAPASALIRQEEEPITMQVLGEGSEEEFKNNRHLYGVKATRNVGYGYWQYASHSTLS